jgi:hypothetical protein
MLNVPAIRSAKKTSSARPSSTAGRAGQELVPARK